MQIYNSELNISSFLVFTCLQHYLSSFSLPLKGKAFLLLFILPIKNGIYNKNGRISPPCIYLFTLALPFQIDQIWSSSAGWA